jgi:hypothetical protein
MPTAITDKTDFASIEEILKQFEKQTEVDVYSSKMSPIERTIAMGQLQINELIVQPENDKLLFVLSNGTVIERRISQLPVLSAASLDQLHNFENMGDGILWKEVAKADLSLKYLLEEELLQKYNLKVA